MANELNDYSAKTADWRSTLRRNARRTYIIIFLFFLIYASVGIVVDMYIVEGRYPYVPLTTLAYWLITFKIMPLATSCMIMIAAVSLGICYLWYDQLMLLGTEYKEISPDDTVLSDQEFQLYNVIEEMKIAAGLNYMPKIYIIEACYMNAFASGFSENSAMIAITRGLLDNLDRDELTAVMAHELSHIRHLDIRLTLTASLLSNLTLMIIDQFFYSMISGKRSQPRNSIAFIIFALRYLLPVINLLMILYLSRTRELMADAGCVQLMRNNEPLARALLKIQDDHLTHRDKYSLMYQGTAHENVRREAYIYDPFEAGISDLTSFNDIFSTHPSIENRLAALGYKKKNDTTT